MRDSYGADWAFGIKGAIENIVRASYPAQLRSWPILQCFDFEAYEINNSYVVFILKDKLSGIPAGPGTPKTFPYSDYPKLPPEIREMELWQFYLRKNFSLREEDVAILIPLYDCGKNSAPDDYAMFSTEEQFFWNQQISYVVSRYKGHLDAMTNQKPDQPTNITYNVNGTNTRVNVNSTDSSVNIVNTENISVFNDLRDTLVHIENKEEKETISKSITKMEAEYGTNNFITEYQNFMSLISNHMTVFAPLLPALAGLLS